MTTWVRTPQGTWIETHVYGRCAPVVHAVFDLPCYLARAGALTLEHERNDPARVAHVNALVHQVVEAAGQHVVPLSSFVCPDGQERTDAEGQPLRYDGVHLTQHGVSEFWAWLTPILRQIVTPAAPAAPQRWIPSPT